MSEKHGYTAEEYGAVFKAAGMDGCDWLASAMAEVDAIVAARIAAAKGGKKKPGKKRGC